MPVTRGKHKQLSSPLAYATRHGELAMPVRTRANSYQDEATTWLGNNVMGHGKDACAESVPRSCRTRRSGYCPPRISSNSPRAGLLESGEMESEIHLKPEVQVPCASAHRTRRAESRGLCGAARLVVTCEL